MKTREVTERLGISRQTLLKIRHKLGIVEETRRNVSPTMYELIAEQAHARAGQEKRPKSGQEYKKIAKSGKTIDCLPIRPHDANKVADLKDNYNLNAEILQFLGQLIREQIEDHKQPEKYLLDAVEKYQRANVVMLKAIKTFAPETDELAALIEEKLKGLT